MKVVCKFPTNQRLLIVPTRGCTLSTTTKIRRTTRTWAPSTKRKEQWIISHKIKSKISVLSHRFWVTAMLPFKIMISKKDKSNQV